MDIIERSNHEVWQKLMKAVAQAISLKTKGEYILKGGTGLLLGHGLDRHSTDLDFDSNGAKDIATTIQSTLEKFSGENVYIRIIKNTDTTQKFMAHLGNTQTSNPLKVETSFRGRDNGKGTIYVDGIKIYDIETLAEQKLKTMMNRCKARDIYDANFLFANHPNAIKPEIALKVYELLNNHGNIDTIHSIINEEAIFNDHDNIFKGKDIELIVLKLYENVDKFCKSIEESCKSTQTDQKQDEDPSNSIQKERKQSRLKF